MFYPGKRISPYKLWVGSAADSRNPAAARKHGVSLVVNCTRTLPFRVHDAEHARVAVDDTPVDAPTMLASLPGIVRLIDRHLSRGDGVLVHCYAGISRSATVAAAYLMYKERLTPQQAIARVRRLKPETFGREPVFLHALQGFRRVLLSETKTRATAASRR